MSCPKENMAVVAADMRDPGGWGSRSQTRDGPQDDKDHGGSLERHHFERHGDEMSVKSNYGHEQPV